MRLLYFIVWAFGKMVKTRDGNAMVVRHLHKFSVIFWGLEVVGGVHVLALDLHICKSLC